MNEQQEFSFLDILNIISIIMQFDNYSRSITIKDISKDNQRAVDVIQEHLESQDVKIDKIMEVLQIATD